MPQNISCSSSDSSVDITWQTPDTKCSISGFDVTWNYNVLWRNESGSGDEKLEGVNSFSVQEIIPYTEYSVQVATLVVGQRGDEFARCSVETPEKSKFLHYSKVCSRFS